VKSVAKKSLKAKTQTPAFKPWTRNAFAGLLIVAAVSFILSAIGITWGETGYIPWQDDSLAGLTTVREMPRLFGEWTYKYPPLQFMINAVFYQPLLDSWHNNLDYNRMNTLIFTANIISMLMGVGAVIAVFLTARILFDDFLAAFFAALSLALCQEFLFYSHLGNVDVPATFWFAWGAYFAVKAAYIGKVRHYIFAAIFCAFSTCTKDSIPPFIAGLLIAIAILIITKAKNSGKTLRQALLSLFNGKVVTAIIVFLFCYALINGIFTSPETFIKRVSIWLGGRGVKEGWAADYTGQWGLLLHTCSLIYYSFGWPLLALIAASLIYCAAKFRLAALLSVLPLTAFYLVVTVNIHFVHSRYLIPAFPCLVLVAGKGCADWLRWKKTPILFRAAPIAIIYVLSILYCVGLDLELLNDSRYDAEAWLVKNVGAKDHVAILTDIRWAPRLQLTSLDYSYRIGLKIVSPITPQILAQKPVPQYVVLNENYLNTLDPAFRKALLDSSLGYKEVAKFENKYFYPKKTVFGFAGWPVPKTHFISPTVLIFEHQ
jgi:hypothetical protein